MDGERDLAERARPFLIQAYSNALTHAHACSAAGIGDDGQVVARARVR